MAFFGKRSAAAIAAAIAAWLPHAAVAQGTIGPAMGPAPFNLAPEALRGRLVEPNLPGGPIPGGTIFVPSEAGVDPFRVELPETLKDALRASSDALPELVVTLDRAPEDGLAAPLVLSAQLPSVSLLEANEDALMAPELTQLRESLVSLRAVSESALGPERGAMGEDVRIARLNSISAAQSTLALLAETSAEDPRRTPLVETSMAAFQTLIDEARPGDADADACADRAATLKAIYCRESLYSLESYRKIAAISNGVVGIGRMIGGKIELLCSGALIGDNLVLTSAHCFLREKLHHGEGFHPINDFRVSFDHEDSALLGDERKRHDVKIEERLFPDLTDRTSLPENDFVLLKIAETPQPKGLLAWVGLQTSRKICLSTRDAAQNEQIYLIGHPKGEERAIADFGRVMFPYRIRSQSKLDELSATVLYGLKRDLDAAGAATVRVAGAGGAIASGPAEKAFALWRRWRESYVKEDSGFVHSSAQWGGAATIGLEIDGYEGNSGGPVVARASHRQIGVFRAGQPDADKILTPSWRTHEAALPIESVMSDMAKSPHSDWMETYRVCIYGRDGAATLLWSDDATLEAHCDNVCL